MKKTTLVIAMLVCTSILSGLMVIPTVSAGSTRLTATDTPTTGTTDGRILADVGARNIWVNQTTQTDVQGVDTRWQSIGVTSWNITEITEVGVLLKSSGPTTLFLEWNSNQTDIPGATLNQNFNFGGTPTWLQYNLQDTPVEAGVAYRINLSGIGNIYYANTDVYANGRYQASATNDMAFKLEGAREYHKNCIWRIIGSSAEQNIFNLTSPYTYNGSVRLKIPVSSYSTGITEVANCSSWQQKYTLVNSLTNVVNGTYWYDSVGNFVYVGVNNIVNGHQVNISVNTTHKGEFKFLFPEYRKVGDDISLKGVIRDADDTLLNNVIAYSHIYYTNGTIAVGPTEWNVLSGNFEAILPTTSLVPGVYNISVNFTNASGTELNSMGTIYLSYAPIGGIYSDATVYFSFYNTNEGLGLPDKTLKVYINGSRLYSDSFHGYVGQTLGLIVRDYYNNKMLEHNFTINGTTQFIDLGLTYHSWLFGNSNEDYYMISIKKSGGTRWWERGIIPYGEREFLIPSGTYCLRIYDRDNVEIYNSTLPESVAVVNSKVYVIFGSNLSEIISGQSVIKGDLLELQNDLDDATRVEINKKMSNAPCTFSSYDKTGICLAGTVLICPPIVYTAETVNQSFLRSSNTPGTSHPFIPTNSSANGSITTVEDSLYFSANAANTFITLTYDGNTTNYSFVPPPIHNLKGMNVTITCDGNVSISRATRYQATDEFDWTKFTATSKYSATVDIKNPFTVYFDNNDTIWEVYCMMGFANDTTPDYATVTLYDVTNGEYLTEGINYGYTGDAIQWKLPFILANATRSFRANYTASTGAITPSNAVKVVHDYNTGTYNDENYWYFKTQWVNPGSTSFVGTLDIQFNFTTPKPIASNSLVIYDEDNSRYLDRDEFIFHGGGITISQDTLGTVSPSNARNFEVYFLYQDIPGGNGGTSDEPDFVSTGVNPLREKMIGDFPLGWIIAFALLIIGILVQYNTKVKVYTKGGKIRFNTISLCLWFIAFMMFVVTGV